MKDRNLLAGSAVVLALALVASGVMLVKAWRNMSSADLRATNTQLLGAMDEVQAELAANETLLRVRGVSPAWPAAEGLQDALAAAARSSRDAVSHSDTGDLPPQLAAVAFHVAPGAEGDVWLASPLGAEDVAWLRKAAAGLARQGNDGAVYVTGAERSHGVAFATFDVAGDKRLGGLYWMLALRKSVR